MTTAADTLKKLDFWTGHENTEADHFIVISCMFRYFIFDAGVSRPPW